VSSLIIHSVIASVIFAFRKCFPDNRTMGPFLATGRLLCFRQLLIPRSSRPFCCRPAPPLRVGGFRRPLFFSFRLPPVLSRAGQRRRRRLLLASSGALLVPGAILVNGNNLIVDSTEDGENEDEDDDGKTGEERMLAESRRELANQVPALLANSKIWRRRIYFLFDMYLWEPVCTALRFFHLLAIFTPLVLAVPAVWVGRRIPERDNERTGTLWWYRFLVWSMEKAGASFIKVGV
jgi:hypothetical protein